MSAVAAHAHLGPPRFHGDYQAAYHLGPHLPENFPHQWWFESRWPNGDGVAHSTKSAVLRADDPWSAQRAGGFFKDSGYREIHYEAPYRSVRRRGSEAHVNFCRQTRDDPLVPGDNPRPLNLVYWEPAPRDRDGLRRPGEVTWCQMPTGANLRSFALVLDSANTWHTRRAWPSGTQWSEVYDLQAVATHEFGHATGFARHFNETLNDDGQPDEWSAMRANCGARSSKRETMCRAGDTGKAYERTLGSHDIHTFKSVYP